MQDKDLLRQPLRGMHDMLPEEKKRYQHVVTQAEKTAGLYGFLPIETPVLERADLFLRGLGADSDIVSKEMYRFEDRGGNDITLRPENTAGALRAVISAGLYHSLPLQFFYAGPMFRRERPQKGRLRQFHQCGVEFLGSSAPEADIEVIQCGIRVIRAILGKEVPFRLEINSLADFESREKWHQALFSYFDKSKKSLSAISRDRLERAPLRILDSREEEDQAVIAGAPSMDAFISQASQNFFARVCDGLKAQGTEFFHNPHLVRGLDYYCHTVFELKSDMLGAQSTLLAGGRYDGLSEMLSGPPLPAVGWAAGLERLMLLLEKLPAEEPNFGFVAIDDECLLEAMAWAEKLRDYSFNIAFIAGKNLKQKMKQAGRRNLRAVLLLGEEEAGEGKLSLKDMATGAQERLPFDDLVKKLKKDYFPS